MDIPRYLMVTCGVCKSVKFADSACHYCGAIGPIEGRYYNRAFVQMVRANASNAVRVINHVARRVGIAA